MPVFHRFARLHRTLPATLVAVASLVWAPLAASAADDGGWKNGWKNGIKWKSADGQNSVGIGGRILLDFAGIDEDAALKTAFEGEGTGFEFRAARIFVKGTAYNRLAWKAEYDFASDSIKDVWIALKKVPHVGTLKFGHFKEPFSLEEITSLRFTTFMERSLAAAFNPSRNMGIQVNDQILDKRATYAVGFFRETEDDFGDTKGFGDTSGYQLTARATGLPIDEDGGQRLLHVGAAFSHKFRDIGGGEYLQWSQRPESHLAKPVADTGNLDTDGANLLNIEAAMVAGPLSVQAEYTSAWSDLGVLGTSRSWAAYVEASYFLTGEHRNYDRKKGAFARNTILKPLGEGWGAWQIATRLSRLKVLDENGTNAGDIRDVSLGLNWYLYSNFRVMANYVYSDVNNAAKPADGDAHIYQMRAQIDF